MVYYIITLPVTIIFLVYGVGFLFYAIKLREKFPKEHNFYNSFLAFILWVLAGLVYPLFFWTDNSNIIFFLQLSMFFICLFTPSLIFLILFYQYLFVVKKNPDIKNERNIDNFLINLDKKNNRINDSRSYDLKTDLHRKALHLFGAGMIIILWIFAVYIWEDLWKANEIWGISGKYFARFLVLTAGYSSILVFGALDFVRLSFIFENRNIYHLIPDKVLNLLCKSMKRKENFEFIKPVILILSFVPIFFFPFGVFAAAALIATIGDGAASIFGLRFGKIHIPKTSDKTLIGYIAGFLSSFGISILLLSLFEFNLGINKILIIALSGAIIFLIIDLLNLKIDDNILNPILCAVVMGILYFLL